jgi:hypothetical protein
MSAADKCAVKMAQRAVVGETLQVFCDNFGNVILYPFGGLPSACPVYLVDGDRVSIGNISTDLGRQYHLGKQEFAEIIAIDRVIFDRNTCIGKVKLSRLKGVTITPTQLAANRLLMYPRHEDLIFEADRC